MINSPTVPQLDSQGLTDTNFSTFSTSKSRLNFIPFIDLTKCTERFQGFQATHKGLLPSGISHVWPFECPACCFMGLSVKCHHGHHGDLNQISREMIRIRQIGFPPKLCYLLSRGGWTDFLSSSVRWGIPNLYDYWTYKLRSYTQKHVAWGLEHCGGWACVNICLTLASVGPKQNHS